jgi:hypothetical protein
MFVLGHLGIGRQLARRAYEAYTPRERRTFFVGALLPDLVDKPLYYAQSWITGKEGAALGLIAGTHSFGHTALFLALLAAAMRLTGAGWVRALTVGVATHLGLDVVGLTMDAHTLLWPLLGWSFTPFRHHGLGEHLLTVLRPVTFAGEIVGAALLIWEYRKRRRPPPTPPAPSRPSSRVGTPP